MDPSSYLEEDYSSLDGLDDDVFHSDDFGLAGQPGEMTSTGIFTQNQSYSCLLGRFQLFPLTHCCGPGSRHAEQQDKATQTLSPSSSSQDVMLPYGVTEEPQRLFYGKRPPESLALQQGKCPSSTFSLSSSPTRQQRVTYCCYTPWQKIFSFVSHRCLLNEGSILLLIASAILYAPMPFKCYYTTVELILILKCSCKAAGSRVWWSVSFT